MTTTEVQRSYIDMLRAELKQYEASKARAAEMLTGNAEYRTLVLAGWDRAIANQQARIQREEARA